MAEHTINSFGQAVGLALPGWMPVSRPTRETLRGSCSRLEPLGADAHADALHRAFAADAEGRMWTYLPYGPFGSAAEYRAWVEVMAPREDPLIFAIVEPGSGLPVGVAAYLRIDPQNGVIEVGHLAFAPALQRTRAATEAMFLLIDRVFALGYRRCEWKCDALNQPSRDAAVRLGFTHEGCFRQAVVVKGRNRDTAWYSILDSEWPARRAAFQRWLDPSNFDASGRQLERLRASRGCG